MRYVEKQSKTVEDAVELALKDLNADRDQVEIEVLDEGNRGILGFLAKAAKVRVTLKKKPEEIAIEFVEQLMKRLGYSVDVELEDVGEFIKIHIKGENVGPIIGRHGSTLDAIQYLVNLVVNKDTQEYHRIIIDVENYRKRREESLEKLAQNISRRVKSTRKSFSLEPMLAYERRIIHTALQSDQEIVTKSVGEEPNRRIIISLK